MSIRRIAFSLMTALTLCAPFAATGAQETSWTVTSQHLLEIEGVPMALSPDGTRVAGVDAGYETFCVWDIETLEATCDGEVKGVPPESVAWAPDSSAVAFSLNSPKYLYDSDLYVFDVASGTLENLTDDNDAGESLMNAPKEPVHIDLYPTWSPDSQSLAFARTTVEESVFGAGTSLMMIPRDGRDAGKVATLSEAYPMAVSSPMMWLEDDSIILSIFTGDPEDPQQAVLRVSLEGDIEQVMGGTIDDEVLQPLVMAVSPDGTQASVISRPAFYDESGDAFWMTSLDDASTVPWTDVIKLPAGLEIDTPPVFAPDGDTVAFVARDGDEFLLAIASTATGEVVVTEPFESPLHGDQTSRMVAWTEMDWTDDRTVFIATPDGAMLVTVDGQS